MKQKLKLTKTPANNTSLQDSQCRCVIKLTIKNGKIYILLTRISILIPDSEGGVYYRKRWFAETEHKNPQGLKAPKQ